MERICVYPGSFDPVTLGHEDVIRRAAKLFDRLIVAVMHNPQKTGCFPVQERMALLEKLTRDLPNVTIDCWDGLLVDYVRTHQASVVVRGLRAVSDFESELTMAQINSHLLPGMETYFPDDAPGTFVHFILCRPGSRRVRRGYPRFCPGVHCRGCDHALSSRTEVTQYTRLSESRRGADDMLNNSQGSQGNNDLQTAQNAIAILIDQISKARGVGRTIVIDKNWLNNQLSALQNSLPAAVHQAQAVLKEKETTLSRAQQEAEMQRQTAADDAQRLKAQAEKEAAAARAEGEKARADAQKDAEAAKQEAERIRAGAASQANADARAIIDKANNEARNIIYKAQQDANRLVQADAIRQQAEKEAETLTAQANEDIAKRQADCQQYIAGQLANLDSYMTQMLQNVRNARSQVRGQ